MMKTYARVAEDRVAEVFTTDGDISQMFHPDLLWVDVSTYSPMPESGWRAVRQDEGDWHFSRPLVPPPTVAEILSLRDMLLVQADQSMSPLMDAFVLGELTAQDEERLRALSQYRKALRTLAQQTDFPASVEWPAKPA